MNTRIILNIEIEVDGIWEHYSCPYIKSNKLLYSKLGNPKCSITDSYFTKAISKPKGLPEDISKISKLLYDTNKYNWYGESWFNLTEILALDECWRQLTGKGLETEIITSGLFEREGFILIPVISSNINSAVNVRFVFWFFEE